MDYFAKRISIINRTPDEQSPSLSERKGAI
jgi:hypothetical protein